MADLVIYNDGELELDVSIEADTIWLTQKQIAELFEVTTATINEHIKNIFANRELSIDSTIRNFLIVRQEGKRKVKRNLEHYNLDVIISVGYRVNSFKATKFRQWATSVLKGYMLDGYVINGEKITHQRFITLENDVTALKSKVENISNSLEDKSLKPKQGIFFDGQIFDAYLFVSKLVKKAKSSIILIDNYCDETTLSILSKCEPKVKVTILTKSITKELKIDLQKHNAQYPNMNAKAFTSSHDRFLIIDEVEIYHIGASLKDLGKKWFALSLLEVESFGLMGRVKKAIG
jgi:hypothetical protein